MKRITKVRIIGTIIFLILDILILPTVIEFPLYLKNFGIEAPDEYFRNIDLFATAQKVLTDSEYRNVFLAIQPLMLLILFSLLWKDAFKRKETKVNKLGGPAAAGSGEFGTARWLTDKELEQKTTAWWTDKVLTAGGVVIHIEEFGSRFKVLLETSDSHSLSIGTTRSGKTRTHILPSIWATGNSGESMLINDPKGELYAKTNSVLRQKGYDIVLLDFRNPYRGNRWNPMKLIIDAINEGDESRASEAAIDMAHTLVYQTPRTGDPIWANGTKAVIAALALDNAIEASDASQKHLTSVYNTLVELGTPIPTTQGDYVPLNDYFRNKKPGSIVKNAFGPAAIAAERTRASFYGGAATDMFLFSDPGISNLTAYSDHELADIGKKKTAVFMIVPDEKSTRHVLASLYVDQTYQALVQLANENNGRIPNRVNFFLDEFGNMPQINGFDNKITVAAGRGMRFHLSVQGFGQLKEKYGDKAGTIKSNCHTWIYLLTRDEQTAEEISKMTGKYTIESQSLSSSMQPKSYSHGLSSALAGRSLLDASEVKRNPYGQGIVFLQREYPAMTNLPDYTDGPAANDIYDKEPETVPYPKINVPLFIPGLTQSEEDEEDDTLDNEKHKVVASILDKLDQTSPDQFELAGVENEVAATSEPIESEAVSEETTEVETEDVESMEFEEEISVVEEVEISVDEVEELKEVVNGVEEVGFDLDDIDLDIEEIDVNEDLAEETPKKKFSLDDLD